jgi:hypothetical protein
MEWIPYYYIQFNYARIENFILIEENLDAVGKSIKFL